MGKTMKVMAGITSTVFMLGVAGCVGSSQDQMSEKEWNDFTGSNQSSSGSSSGSSSDTPIYDNEDIPPVPDDQNCTDWEWDSDDGVYQCADGGSSYYHHYYHGGRYYSSKPDLFKNSEYMKYKNSSIFKGKGTANNTSGGTSTNSGTSANSSTGSDGSTVKGSSGFGSGSNSFGG